MTIYDFEFDNAIQHLKTKIFDKPSEEWSKFVMMNRDETITHPAHDYDLVIGPIADDSVVVSFRLFQDGYITISELVRRLEYKELSTQYFFHNTKAISYLTRVL